MISPRSPHESYAATLRESDLDTTALGQDWLRAAATSLERPVQARSPFQETGYFAPDTPNAIAYGFELQRGRRLSLEVTVTSSAAARVFVDLFAISSEDIPQRVAFLEADKSALIYQVENDGRYVVRVQPELLRGVRYTIVQRTLASLPFPIPGKSTATVQSTFGAERDAGARQHQGIDIFVPHGTPATAVTAGVARSSQNTLGGNVVWLHDSLSGRTYYYAHLDRWAIDGVSRVSAGDVLGYVGNTGNARTTPPHLHFGLYQRGAIDPLPFLQVDDPAPSPPMNTAIHLGAIVRTTANRTRFLAGPAAESPAGQMLDRYTIARMHGITASWARVSLPDGTSGYLPVGSLASATAPVRQATFSQQQSLRELPTATAPVVTVVDAHDSLELLGRFGDYVLLRPSRGQAGWTISLD